MCIFSLATRSKTVRKSENSEEKGALFLRNIALLSLLPSVVICAVVVAVRWVGGEREKEDVSQALGVVARIGRSFDHAFLISVRLPHRDVRCPQPCRTGWALHRGATAVLGPDYPTWCQTAYSGVVTSLVRSRGHHRGHQRGALKVVTPRYTSCTGPAVDGSSTLTLNHHPCALL